MTSLRVSDQIKHLFNDRRPLLLTVALAAVFYWLIYNPFMQEGGVDTSRFTNEFQVVPETLLTPAIQPDTAYVPHKGIYHWEYCPGPCFFAARVRFEVEGSSTDWGVLPIYNTDNFELYINNHKIASPGRMVPMPSFHGQRSTLIKIPADLLVEGTNTLDVILARNMHYAKFRGAFVGPYQEVLDATSMRTFMLYDFRQINAAIGLVLGCLALILVALVRNRSLLFWFASIAIAWGLFGMFRHWDNFPFEYPFRAGYYFFLLNYIYLSIFNFYDLWSGENQFRQRQVATGLFVLIVVLYFGLQPWYSSLDLEAWLSDAFQILISGWLTLRAVRHYLFRTEPRIVEAAAMLICISSVTVDVWAQYLGFNTYYTMPRTLIIFIIAILAALFHRNIRLYESQQALNDILEEKVNEQQASLEATYQQLRDLDRAKTLAEERRRVLGDMHDGLGGQLVGLLAGLTGGNMTIPAVKAAIEQSLQDLRLLIDSLDEVSEDLVIALGKFRGRIEPMLENAGIELHWQVSALPFDTQLPPRSILNVFRILQEAVTNALKHSGASSIIISDGFDESGCYMLTVEDKGEANAQSSAAGAEYSQTGYGLKHMTARAQEMGGDIALVSTSTGTRLTLSLLLDTKSGVPENA